MKDPRFVYLAPVAAAVALPVLSLMVYAGFLTHAWGTLLASTPAVLAMIGVVAAIASGMLLFGDEEEETPEEAARPDGGVLFDRFGAWVEDRIHRLAIRLHVHGVGR